MNFLQLCQKSKELSGTQGSLSSVSGLSAGTHLAFVVDAVKKAYVELQTYRNNFNFLRDTQVATITTTTSVYTTEDLLGNSSIFGSWIELLYNKTPLRYIPYDVWIRSDYSTPSKPTVYTILPSNGAILFNILDASYNIDCYFFRAPQDLVNNTDLPILPAQHHYTIIYGAVVEISLYTGEVNLYQRYINLYNAGLNRILRDEIPQKRVKLNWFA